jgi:hypothetical protein
LPPPISNHQGCCCYSRQDHRHHLTDQQSQSAQLLWASQFRSSPSPVNQTSYQLHITYQASPCLDSKSISTALAIPRRCFSRPPRPSILHPAVASTFLCSNRSLAHQPAAAKLSLFFSTSVSGPLQYFKI